MADRDLVSMAQQFTGLPMDALIGGPLNAAATANSAMALTQTKFILDTGFEKQAVTPATDPATYEYKPIMVTMSLHRSVLSPPATSDTDSNPPTITQFVTKFEVPLLTIIPINSLGVDKVDITFEMEVKSSFSEDQTESKTSEKKGDASLEATLGWGPLSATIKGSVSYDNKDSQTHDTHYQKSNSAKYTVNVHAGQLPLPKGVNTIIEAFTRAIEPIIITPKEKEKSA